MPNILDTPSFKPKMLHESMWNCARWWTLDSCDARMLKWWMRCEMSEGKRGPCGVQAGQSLGSAFVFFFLFFWKALAKLCLEN
jgi:hypothetical protein